jgi:hypothetical protein
MSLRIGRTTKTGCASNTMKSASVPSLTVCVDVKNGESHVTNSSEMSGPTEGFRSPRYGGGEVNG